MTTITMDQMADFFASVGQVMTENSEMLCEMDANLGDGDLGLTMKKGFSALPDLFLAIEEESLGKRIAKAGMKMSSVVPSTMGTLMSSGIMAGGKALGDAQVLDATTYALYLEAFAQGIMKRGKCSAGDRTVLDAILPAAQAATAASLLEGATLETVAQAALQGALEGVEATRTMTPKFGKAAVFADRSQGIEDQGAVAGALMVRGYCNYICQ